jgi:hypothetical protein
VAGNDGDDWIKPGPGADTLVNGGSNGAKGDTVDYWDMNEAVDVDLATTNGHDGGASDPNEDAVAFENVSGSDQPDVLRGTDGRPSSTAGSATTSSRRAAGTTRSPRAAAGRPWTRGRATTTSMAATAARS